MFGGVNPKQVNAMMKQMGMSQEEISASRVIIERGDETKIIIENPNVTKIEMQGQETFQVTGDITEESAEVGVSEEDVQTVIEKTGSTEERVREVLEQTGDLAETILELSE